LVTEKKPPLTGGFLKQNEDPVLKFANILRSWTFWAGDNIKADPLTFGQGFETFSLDRGMMHEKIFAPSCWIKPNPFESLNHFTVPSC